MPLVKTKKGEYKEFPYTPEGIDQARKYAQETEGKIVDPMDKMKSDSRKRRSKLKKERKAKIKGRVTP